ncbi:hypothetical protein GOBAR_DD04886 [Gossypium barbadense]|nr:hypothetical protein GOBAR_DD04886 [Gossypium barbadense]
MGIVFLELEAGGTLHLAACEGWIEVVDLFLEKGADVNYLDHCGRTPLSDAHSFRHNEVCKILEARGGIDPVGMDSQAPCFEIDHNKVNMEEATRIEEISSSAAPASNRRLTTWCTASLSIMEEFTAYN